MATAIDVIYGALRLIGQLAEGEPASADTSQDALNALNQMIESWSTERLAVYATIDQVFTWPANQVSRTLGPTGSLVGTRPVQVDTSTYFLDTANGVSYGITLVNEDEYNSIALKTVTSTYPQVMWVNMTHPDATLYVYPVPATSLQFHIVSVQELSQPATLVTALSFPPGYLRCFRYNLACELAPEFGVEPSAQVRRIAMTSKRNLKRINNPDDVLSMPRSLIAGNQRFNVYTGNY